ncbi:amino acid adenylation domain-containing protein [Nocardia sp. CA-128927]|uniref:amino acid adenylation domain-containing protein n=1 Tax=Nocardia sp. CA-128927 TaxID=3239975 RepID=UPI003D95FBF2
MSDTDATMTALQRRKQLLQRRMRESGLTTTESTPSPVRRVAAGERHPLAPGQRRMWFLQSRDLADPTLNICLAYRLTGALDEVRLQTVVARIVARHDILRTTYGVDDEGEPFQVFQDDAEIDWVSHDLTDLPELGRARRVEVLARREFGRPFDRSRELPLRVTLVRTGAYEFVLVLVIHHICWDDDSWAVFFGELNAAYRGDGEMSDTTAQFVAVEVLDAPADAAPADIEYWRDTLRPLPEPLELPGSAKAIPSKRAERCAEELPAELLARVDAFARARAATPFMVLLAAFDALIQRYTAATDFLVSIPVTNRRASAEGLIGYLGNTLLLRATMRSEDTFTTLVDSVREACVGAFTHQGVGIDRVIREANPERFAGRDAMEQLVRLGFSVRQSTAGFALSGVTATELALGASTAQIPLALAVVLNSDGKSRLEAEYQVDVLGRPLVKQLLLHFVQLLDCGLAEPDRRLGELDMLGPSDRAAILRLSHGELVDSAPTTLIDLLEGRAAAAPEALALVSDADEMTYAELHRRSNRLAHWLIRQGVGSDDIVGLRLVTSVEFIVAVLAVLKAGAAYLPINPAYPDDRIDYLIEDSAPLLVLGPSELAEATAAATQLPESNPTDAERVRPLRPAHLAYVIYTSGSTGQPKGVPVPHAAIADHIAGFAAEWEMTADDRVLQSASVSFDASVGDIFVTLALGARLIVPKPDAFEDVRYVADLIARRGVTVLQLVPSMLSTLMLLPEMSEWRALQRVPVGGEALAGEVADKFTSAFDAELRNHYGPTEAVVCATHMPVEGPQGVGTVSIGFPNRNVYAYVLDEALQLVPAGVVGEIYLGGVQLARGYLGRSSATAERFVADPFQAGARLYRTGDLARRNNVGQLDFIGRADQQFKVRGFRIEPGEIEATIAAHPAIGHCVVVISDNLAAGPILAAYVVPAADLGAAGDIDLEQVRAHTAAALPEYMVPSAFLVIDKIPLTVNGKLDKRALPAPTSATERQYREPATATERRICAIFAQLFAVQRVGADYSFFELGGHSLLAARLVARIRAEFGVELDVRSVFDTPTAAGLAVRLVARFRDEFGIDLDAMDMDEVAPGESDDSGAATGSERPQLGGRPREGVVPLSYSQLAMWCQHRMEGPSTVGNLPFAVRLDGALDSGALAAAIGDVVARHEALRTTFPERDGLPYQFVHPVLEVPVPSTRIAADRLDAELAEIATYRFALDGEPLIRARLLLLDAQSSVLSLLVHHIVADHASFGIFLADLIAAYRSRVDGGAPQWAPLSIQYTDYALWQRDVFDTGTAGTPSPFGQSQIDYWRTKLADVPDEISVAPDRPRPRVLGKQGEVVTFTVPPVRRNGLTALAEQCGASEFMVYDAVLATVLHKLGGGTDIPLGTPVAARVDEAAGNLVGLFANMVVLRNDLSGNPTLRDTVIRGRDVVLDAYGHQEMPIERLVEALNPTRSRSRNPLFQSMIHFRGADWAPATVDLSAAGDTTITVLPVDFDISFLDLNLSFNVTVGGGLDVRVVANADLYDPATTQLIADAVATTLDAYATVPDRTVAELRVLAQDDLERLLEPPAAMPSAAAELPRAASDEPQTATERTLIELLEELLEVSDVEADDGFFALGGDSVISIQWSARAAALGLPLTPQLVFEHLTIAELAAAVDAAAEQPAPESDSAQPGQVEHAPMSASGLDADALAALTASWQAKS